MTWRRVSKANPCPVCGKPDWCMVKPDGSAAACARVPEGCAKDRDGRPITFRDGMGWVHQLVETDAPCQPRLTKKRTPRRPDPAIPFEAIARACHERIQHEDIWPDLGLSREPLMAMRTGIVFRDALARLDTRCPGRFAWTFPMRRPDGSVCGIRLRHETGEKRSIKGSHAGLFIPVPRGRSRSLFIVEGPTDTAAMWDLGLDAIGRHACRGQAEEAAQLARGREVVIVEDNDGPGRDGARSLADDLLEHAASVKVIRATMGANDPREWKAKGATRAVVAAVVKSARPWTRREAVA
ncbi:MAG: hypothetical protein RIB60_06160 [Phycisphaerales bacterium]